MYVGHMDIKPFKLMLVFGRE